LTQRGPADELYSGGLLQEERVVNTACRRTGSPARRF